MLRPRRSRRGDRIDASRKERLAAADSPDGKQTAVQQTVPLQAANRVFRAGRIEAAAFSGERREENLPESAEENQEQEKALLEKAEGKKQGREEAFDLRGQRLRTREFGGAFGEFCGSHTVLNYGFFWR